MTYEVFEEDRPSYLPSYIMSGFVLVGVVSLANHVPAWPPPLATVFLCVWFGVLFRWMLLNARAQRQFSSHRLTVTPTTYRHSYRYAVAEATEVEMPLASIREVRVSAAEPRLLEVFSESDQDAYFLPAGADLRPLVEAIREGNPRVRVTY
jgi:hypothetical protein